MTPCRRPFALPTQGLAFSDHVDIALLFWVEVGFFFLMRSLRTGSWRDLLLAGAAQGLAFLCKSYLAAILTGVALAAWLGEAGGLTAQSVGAAVVEHRRGPVQLVRVAGANAP